MEPRIQQLLDRLSEDETRAEELSALDDEALEALQNELIEEFKAVRAGERDDVAPDDLGVLNAIHAGIDALKAEKATREEAAQREAEEAAQREAEAAALEAELLGEGPDEPEVDAEPEGEPVEAAAESEPESADEETPEPEVVEAAAEVEETPEPAPARRPMRRPSLAEMARSRPVESQPRVEAHGPAWQDLSGRELSETEVADRLAAAINESQGSTLLPGMVQKIPVVRLSAQAPAELRLGDDPYENQRAIDQATAAFDVEKRAVLASGGWCAPAEPRYDIPDIAVAARPFRDSLPRFGTNRGTVNFVRAARLSTILHDTTAAAVTVWENTTDETPGESTKTVQTKSCRTIQEEELGAVVARVQIGNFQGRAFPEDVRHFMGLVAAQHARVAEVRLLDALIADINVDITQTGVVGTFRDAKHHFSQAVQNIRYVERMARFAPMRIVISDVLPSAMVADVTMQQASGEVVALFQTEADAERALNSITGVNYTLTRDVSTGAGAFVTNSDGEDLANWPATYEVPIFPDGHAVFVDGGMLDLGITRDSTLNATNDYQMFMETFEGLLWLGPHGETLTLTTCPNGESQIATDETGSLCSAS